MADHLSDEEQIEALKKWWRSNGTSLLFSLVLVVGGWFAWNYWQDQQQHNDEQDSAIYMAMLSAVTTWEEEASAENATLVAHHAENLKKIADDSLYGRFAAMTLARLFVADNELDNAVAELQWAQSREKSPAMLALMALRLANIEFARNNTTAALSLLNQPHPAEFDALFEEAKGDILVADANNAADVDASAPNEHRYEHALAAYQLALAAVSEAEPRAKAMLELKINEITPASTVQNTTAPITNGEDDA